MNPNYTNACFLTSSGWIRFVLYSCRRIYADVICLCLRRTFDCNTHDSIYNTFRKKIRQDEISAVLALRRLAPTYWASELLRMYMWYICIPSMNFIRILKNMGNQPDCILVIRIFNMEDHPFNSIFFNNLFQ